MSQQQQPIRRESEDSTTDSIRKRVCKACDRCRLKKSKCDGSHPCSRCKADNAICVFGERKKSHDKVYPKGYVEMLEQQQGQLVLGLQEMYRRLQTAKAWSGAELPDVNGQPLTHDILAALDLLEAKHDGSGETEAFEEDCQKLQSRLLADGAGYMPQRRGSFSSDSDHSLHEHRSHTTSHPAATLPKALALQENFTLSLPPSPLSRSPLPRQQRPSYPSAVPSPQQPYSPLPNDPQLYRADWAIPDMSSPELLMRSKFAMHGPDPADFRHVMDHGQFDAVGSSYDHSFNGGMPMTPYGGHYATSFGSSIPGGMPDFALDPMDLELNNYVSVTT